MWAILTCALHHLLLRIELGVLFDDLLDGNDADTDEDVGGIIRDDELEPSGGKEG